MKRALTGFTEENLMELSRHLSRTTATVMGSQRPTADIHTAVKYFTVDRREQERESHDGADGSESV